MCNGYWETCKCEECKKVSSLYEELEWLEKDEDFNKDEIKELENKIESMGYFI
jgi:cell division protein FtsB